MQGPNMKRLIAHKMSRDAIPDGGGIAAGIAFLTSGKIGEAAKAATQWCETAILAVRQAAEPNPWKSATDEEIAGELAKQIDDRLKRRV